MTQTRYRRIDILALGFAALTLWSSPAAAEIAVGAARLIVADVSAETTLASRRLATADEVRYQELIATERSSAAVIQLIDGTELAIGEQARVRLDAFVFDPGAAGKLDLSLEFGALRFSTGSMAKPAYRISTPSASLVVRGTEFDLAVDGDGAAYLVVRHGAVEIRGANGESRQVTAGQTVTVSSAGVPTRPHLAAVAPIGALPGKIAAMDAALARALEAASGAASLDDLSVLAKARSLRSGARRDLGRPGKPGGGLKDKRGDKKGDKKGPR
jgi:hypothetical protein